jgi:hypothetical protein
MTSFRPIGRATDYLAVLFADAKLVTLVYDSTTVSLVPSSLHLLEEASMRASKREYTATSRMSVDPDARALSVLLFDRFLATFPIHMDDPPLRTYTLTDTFSHPQHQLHGIRDMAYMHGYLEPTLAILYEAKPSWPGRFAAIRTPCAVAVLSKGQVFHMVDLEDSFQLVPVQLGGLVVVLGPSSVGLIGLNHVKQFCINGYDGQDKDDEDEDAAVRSIERFGVRVSPSEVLAGDVLIRVESNDSVRLTRLDVAGLVRPSVVTTLSADYLYCGFRDAPGIVYRVSSKQGQWSFENTGVAIANDGPIVSACAVTKHSMVLCHASQIRVVEPRSSSSASDHSSSHHHAQKRVLQFEMARLQKPNLRELVRPAKKAKRVEVELFGATLDELEREEGKTVAIDDTVHVYSVSYDAVSSSFIVVEVPEDGVSAEASATTDDPVPGEIARFAAAPLHGQTVHHLTLFSVQGCLFLASIAGPANDVYVFKLVRSYKGFLGLSRVELDPHPQVKSSRTRPSWSAVTVHGSTVHIGDVTLECTYGRLTVQAYRSTSYPAPPGTMYHHLLRSQQNLILVSSTPAERPRPTDEILDPSSLYVNVTEPGIAKRLPPLLDWVYKVSVLSPNFMPITSTSIDPSHVWLCMNSIVIKEKHYVAVGTGTNAGEENASKGRVLIYRVTPIGLEPVLEEEMAGPVSLIDALHNQVLLVQGRKLYMYEFDLERRKLEVNAFIDVDYLPSSHVLVKDYALFGDAAAGVRMVRWKPQNRVFRLLEWETRKISEREGVSALSVVIEDGNLYPCSALENGDVVLLNSEMSIVSGLHVSTYSRVNQMLRYQPKGTDSNIGNVLIASSGRVSVLTPYDESRWRRLATLGAALYTSIPHACGLHPRESRMITGRVAAAPVRRSVLDMDLVCRFLSLDASKKKDVSKKLKVSVSTLEEDIRFFEADNALFMTY